MFVLESVRLPENKEATRKVSQWTVRTATATAAEVNVPAGKHDGTTNDSQPDGTADNVVARDDEETSRVHDAVAVDASNAATLDDDTHSTCAANDAAPAAGRAEWANAIENATDRPAISAAVAEVYKIWDGSTDEEELLTARGRQMYSFKQ